MKILKAEAKSNLALSSSSLLEKAKKRLNNEELIRMPKDNSIQKIVSNVCRPLSSNFIDKVPQEIEWIDFYCETNDSNRFLLVDSKETALERNAPVFLIFSSDRTLEMLRKYKKWSVDGTFFSSPKYFSQLFTLNVL